MPLHSPLVKSGDIGLGLGVSLIGGLGYINVGEGQDLPASLMPRLLPCRPVTLDERPVVVGESLRVDKDNVAVSAGVTEGVRVEP